MMMTIDDYKAAVENARWHPDVSRRITDRIVVEGTLVLQTPAHFGAGDSDSTELLILHDPLTGDPLLPGASIAGALRQYLRVRERGFRIAEEQKANGVTENHTLAAALFGRALDNDAGIQSRLIVDDALGHGAVMDVRDGVKIDGRTRTAEDQKLYTFQVWQPGTQFDLRFELVFYEEDNEETRHLLALGFATALDALGNGEIPLGARKHRGYGQAKVIEGWRIALFNLTNPTGLMNWLQDGGTSLVELETPFHAGVIEGLNITGRLDDQREFVEVQGQFRLLDSLLIRAGSDVVDMVHLHQVESDGNGNQVSIPLLSGTSLTGALRARALKILNTLGRRDAQHIINAMFGAFGDDQDSQQRTASALIVHESKIASAYVFDRVQNRVKIDRFTGGAFDTGLFAQQPLFATDETTLELRLELRFPTALPQDERRLQIGLLLLLLKDLWTGDLPLGGESSIGRGRLDGQELKITIRDGEYKEITIQAGENGSLQISRPELLASYIVPSEAKNQ